MLKQNHRQSRAPWANPNSNPYANTATVADQPQYLTPHVQSSGASTTSRKNTRRLSIHQGATRTHGRSFSLAFDTSNMPPVPQMYATNNASNPLVQSEPEDPLGRILADLSNGTALQIDDYYNLLVKQRAVITRDIKENINENQKYVLQLTDDLKEVQDELMGLRIQTKELYDVLDDFKESAERRIALENEGMPVPASQPTAPLTNRKDRSSILVLEKMWVSELQSLFKHVEGASKYIQALPGRHVVAESGRWQEINVGTWKPVKPTHLFVLNDLVLMATKKLSSVDQGSKSRLQATQCWPLAQVDLTQIEAPANTLHAGTYLINIKHQSLSYVYQTDRFDHFKKITEAYNKARNELLQQERLQNARASAASVGNTPKITQDEDKRKLRELYRSSMTADAGDEVGHKRSSSSFMGGNSDTVLQDISARVHSRNRSHDFGAKRDAKGHYFGELKALEDRLDDVDVNIAHNDYLQAVGLVSHIENKLHAIEGAVAVGDRRKPLSEEVRTLIDVVRLKITNRKNKVVQGLVFDLQHGIARLSDDAVEEIILYFEALGLLDRGVEAYLHAMSTHLSTTVTKLIVGVQGSTKIDVVNYLLNLVVIYVAIIKRLVQVYNKRIARVIHKDGRVDLSGLINWCMDEMAKLVAQLRKHLYGTLLTSAGTNPDTQVQELRVKDRALYNEFLLTIVPLLDQLKHEGVNADYLFEEILVLRE